MMKQYNKTRKKKTKMPNNNKHLMLKKMTMKK
jgi:hypothetical protein